MTPETSSINTESPKQSTLEIAKKALTALHNTKIRAAQEDVERTRAEANQPGNLRSSHYIEKYREKIAAAHAINLELEGKLELLNALPREVIALMRPMKFDLLPEALRHLACSDFAHQLNNAVDKFLNGEVRIYEGDANFVIDGGKNINPNSQDISVFPEDFMIANALTDSNCRVIMGTYEYQSPKIIISKNK